MPTPMGGKIKLHKRGEVGRTPTAATFASGPTRGCSIRSRACRSTAAAATTGTTGSATKTATPCTTTCWPTITCAATTTCRPSTARSTSPSSRAWPRSFRASRTIARYNDLYAANRFTSANSTIVYRDDLFGPAFAGNAFVSEPVHNLVHREIMRPEGLTFRSRRRRRRAATASSWPRPTTGSAPPRWSTGPDGALWVADMYRQTIEHPQWIPQTMQEQIDLRAGSDKGRIYRVYPVGSTPRKIPRLDKLSTAELVAALDSPSGWQRDMVQQMLLWKPDPAAVEPLHKLVAESPRPITRTQALWTLELLGKAPADEIAARHARCARRASAATPCESPKRHLADVARAGRSAFWRWPTTRTCRSNCSGPIRWARGTTRGPARRWASLLCAIETIRYLTAAVLSSVNPQNLAGVTARCWPSPRRPNRRPNCSNNSSVWPAPMTTTQRWPRRSSDRPAARRQLCRLAAHGPGRTARRAGPPRGRLAEVRSRPIAGQDVRLRPRDRGR